MVSCRLAKIRIKHRNCDDATNIAGVSANLTQRVRKNRSTKDPSDHLPTMEAHLQAHLVSNNKICLVCVRTAQEHFFKEVKNSDFWPLSDICNNSLVKLPQNDHLPKWAVLWKYILHSYSNYCKVHYSVPPGVKQPVLTQKEYNKQWKMDDDQQKISCHKYQPVINTFIKSISKLNIPNWSPTVKVCDVIKTPSKPLKRIKSVPKIENRRRNCKIRLVPSVLKRIPNILTAIPYIKLEDCLAPAKKDPVVAKESFMNYFNLANSNEESQQYKVSTKISTSKRLRYNSVPISSNLGRLLVNSNVDTSALVRIERTERYINAAGSSVVPTQYPITYNTKQDNCEHTYKFPKRQLHHQRLSLKAYACLERCRPVKVIVKRMNFDKYFCNAQFSNNRSKGK